MADWSLLTNHARLLLAIGREPGLRRRDMAAQLGLTERSIGLILRDLREAGYVSARREGRRVGYTVVGGKPVRGALAGVPTVGQFLQLFADAEDSAAEARLPQSTVLQAYYMRLRVTEAAEAGTLADALADKGAVILEEEAGIVALLWPATEADHPDEWDERTFAEAIFFLRAWSDEDPRRELTVLEERPVDVPEQAFRRAS